MQTLLLLLPQLQSVLLLCGVFQLQPLETLAQFFGTLFSFSPAIIFLFLSWSNPNCFKPCKNSMDALTDDGHKFVHTLFLLFFFLFHHKINDLEGQILKFTVQQIMESVCKLPGRRLFALEFCNHFHIPHFVCSNTEFGWRFGDWTTCSASCGNRGTWLRRLDCVTPDGKIVPTTKCQHIQKPVTSAVPCNRQDCPPR